MIDEDDPFDDDQPYEPGYDCEECGANIDAQDVDETGLCDQCQWYRRAAHRPSQGVVDYQAQEAWFLK